MGWWDWFERNGITTALMVIDTTKLIYLGKKRQARATKYSDNYRKLRAIVEEMTMINMTLLKENAWP